MLRDSAPQYLAEVPARMRDFRAEVPSTSPPNGHINSITVHRVAWQRGRNQLLPLLDRMRLIANEQNASQPER